MPLWDTEIDWDSSQRTGDIINENVDGYTGGTIRLGYPLDSYSNRILYLRFTESSGTTATDYSGNGNDATIQSGVTLGEPGILGTSSFYFDSSSSSQVYVPHNADVDVSDTNELTLMAWVKRNGIQDDHATIMTKNGAYYFQVDRDRVAIYTYYSSSGGSSYNHSNNIVPSNEWTHICYREDSGGTRTIFINGSIDSTYNMESGIADRNADPLSIGMQFGGGRRFDGWIAYPMMWDVAISDNVISNIASLEVGTITTQKRGL